MVEVGSIEAILTLNASGFETSLGRSQKLVQEFGSVVKSTSSSAGGFSASLRGLLDAINDVNASLGRFTGLAKESESFNKFANGVRSLSVAVETLGSNSNNASVGLERVKEIITSWGNALNGIEVKIKGVSNVIREMSSNGTSASNTLKQVATATKQYEVGLTSLTKAMVQYEMGQTNVQQSIRQTVNAFNSEYMSFEKVNAEAIKSREALVLYRAELMNLAMGIEAFNSIETGNTARLRENQSALNQVASADERVAKLKQQVASSTNQEANAIQRDSVAKQKDVASTNQLTNATSRLGRAMSSLRMMGTMVGSMLAYNFAHKLLVATGETIHAKSEMEGYFKMLNFGQRDINNFNKALDKTVAQFQRVNKYSLGETISSIGVEFNLTTKEMEKAMPVVSMITSEYLRAGRNVNEASLAVKDILQGEFQRLSRETGVKGKQLEEMGWSGDKTDVMGLLDALDKIGKSRNWDVFAEKANSLNDILTIIQNRFGEWSADVVYAVQPSIVGAFNMILESAQKLAGGLESVWKWINGDGIESQIAKWGLLATAITGVATAFIVYRTGANLIQLAQMGLIGTLNATIFGLKAEEVATYGSRNAIVGKITSLGAEKVATLGVRDAILTKVLGLKAETVASMGLKGALTEEVIARRLEDATISGVSDRQKAMIFLEYEEQMAKRGTLATIMAKILGVKMETFAQQGLKKALIERIAQSGTYVLSLIAEKVATMGEAEATLFLIGTISSLVAIIGVVVLALGSWLIALKNSADAMKRFNELNSKGDDIIKENRKTVEMYTQRQEALKKKLSETKQGTAEYIKIQQQLSATNRDITVSTENYKESIKAVERARSSQQKYNETLTDIQIHQQERLTEAYLKMGYSASESMEMANESMREANEGAEQLRRTLSALKSSSDYTSNKMDEFAQQFKDANFTDKEEIKSVTQDYLSARDMYMKGLEKSMTDESFFGRLDGYFTMGEATLRANLDELKIDLDTSNVDEFWKDLWTQVGGSGFGGLGAINGLFESLGWDEIWKGLKISDVIKNINLPAMIGTWMFDNLPTLNEMGDMFNQWADSLDWAEIINGTWEDFSQSVQSLDIFGLVDALLTSIFTSFDLGVQNIIGILTGNLFNYIMSIPIVSDFLQLFGLLNGENTGSSQKGNELGNSFKTAIEDKIRGIPILGDILQLLGVIPQANGDAHSKGEGVGSNIKTGTQSGMGSLGSMIIQEFTDALNGIGKLGQQAYDTAKGWADKLWQGVNSVLQRHSPGFFHDQFQLEFGTDIPNAINESGATAYSVAQSYAQNIKQGIQDSGTTTIGMDGMVQDYQSDAQIISDSSQMMGMTTTTAFNDMALQVNATTGQMQTNVTGTYSAIASNQTLSLNQMKQQNTSAYNEMYLKSNQSLVQMRDSTSNITQQMTSAWNQMKDSIVASANKLKNDSTVHFNSLSDTIGSFYRKIQNPSNWGGSPHGGSTHRNVRAGRSFASTMRGFAGGRGSTYTGSNTMTIASLKKKICPNGDCNGIFDGWNSTDVVDVRSFLSLITDGGFGWGDWSGNHFNYIRDTSNQWGMKSPTIQLVGGIPTNANYKVGDFANGSPKISFGSFQSMAESIYSAIPYRFYYNSDWKGSWLGALQSGACNCYDGALSLIAFANACGFSGSMASGTWTDPDGTSYPHVWAVINGKKMDTTAWQQRGSWSAGSPNIRTSNSNPQTNNNTTPVNIEVNINGNVYGVDDLDRHIEEGIDKGLEKHFNTSYTVGV